MASLAGFNADEHQDDEIGALPAGTYVAIAVASGMKPTKAGNGQFLEVTFEVLDGQYKGRKAWARMNLINSNATAVGIARKELGNLCRAVGVIHPNDSADLHNKPLLITLNVVPGQRREQNEITKYEAVATAGQTPVMGGQAPAANQAQSFGQQTQQQAPAATGTAGVTPPWK